MTPEDATLALDITADEDAVVPELGASVEIGEGAGSRWGSDGQRDCVSLFSSCWDICPRGICTDRSS